MKLAHNSLQCCLRTYNYNHQRFVGTIKLESVHAKLRIHGSAVGQQTALIFRQILAH